MLRDRMALARMLVMLVVALGGAAFAISSSVEDCGPDGDCRIKATPASSARE